MRVHPAIILSSTNVTPKIKPKPDATSLHHAHISWQHIWRVLWPIMLSNITVPLVGVVDVAMMAEYVTIHLFAGPAALANLMLLGGLYGKQRMRLAMALLFIVTAINLLLDIILVNGFGMTF